MQLVTALIHQSQLSHVADVLGCLDVQSLVVSEVQVHRFGQQNGPLRVFRGSVQRSPYVPKLRIDVSVQDQNLERVLTAISVAGGSDIWVVPLDFALVASGSPALATVAA